ncbi:MAG: HAD family hydrolase [Bacteroides sp.]|nr:HAD family hydrolase [Eubacterium sp.]MCM1419602.1 HAD family hydrolase [Roseburia sp.]MCM1463573.1 HAD family hydrolase [Bacteroides sp.]
MKYPKMIIFDYGNTLLCEPDRNNDRGNAALLKYAVKNPNDCTPEDVGKAAKLIYGEHIGRVRRSGYDIGGQVGNRTLYEYLGIEFSLTPLEMETVFWNAASAGAIMPDADKMLDHINKSGIRSAVISNLTWSGAALTERFNRLLPNHRFEFVMTSSDYFIRKPNRVLFDIALQKSGLPADEVWYCGDSIYSDINAAHEVGMFPVLYEGSTAEENPSIRDNIGMKVTFDYLHIHHWSELIATLEEMREA